MYRAAFEGIVKILAVRSSAVDEGGARGGQCPHMADRSARTLVVNAGECALDVILVARGDTEAGDVDQQVLAFRAHARRQLLGVERGDTLGQKLGDGDFGQRGVHAFSFSGWRWATHARER